MKGSERSDSYQRINNDSIYTKKNIFIRIDNIYKKLVFSLHIYIIKFAFWLYKKQEREGEEREKEKEQ